MGRIARHDDFVVPVLDIGTFTFGRRNFGDQLRIAAEYGRLSEGQPLAPPDVQFANMVAELRILTVKAPEGWDIDELDPIEGYEIVTKVWSALRDKEKAFRRGVPAHDAGAGAGRGKIDRVLVPADVQPGAD